MSDLVISGFIKIIIAVAIIALVGFMLYLVFKNQVIDFFKGLTVTNSPEVFLPLLK